MWSLVLFEMFYRPWYRSIYCKNFRLWALTHTPHGRDVDFWESNTIQITYTMPLINSFGRIDSEFKLSEELKHDTCCVFSLAVNEHTTSPGQFQFCTVWNHGVCSWFWGWRIHSLPLPFWYQQLWVNDCLGFFSFWTFQCHIYRDLKRFEHCSLDLVNAGETPTVTRMIIHSTGYNQWQVVMTSRCWWCVDKSVFQKKKIKTYITHFFHHWNHRNKSGLDSLQKFLWCYKMKTRIQTFSTQIRSREKIASLLKLSLSWRMKLRCLKWKWLQQRQNEHHNVDHFVENLHESAQSSSWCRWIIINKYIKINNDAIENTKIIIVYFPLLITKAASSEIRRKDIPQWCPVYNLLMITSSTRWTYISNSMFNLVENTWPALDLSPGRWSTDQVVSCFSSDNLRRAYSQEGCLDDCN